MTITVDPVGRSPRVASATWSAVETGFWAGSAGGNFIGTVEKVPHGEFIARNAVGAEIGSFDSSREARAAVVDSENGR